MIRRLKLTPLPPSPTFIDRLEYGIQWSLSWFVLDIPGHPCISGILTGLLLFVPVIGVASLVNLVLGALLKLFQ